jgi:hypothetical protein
MVRDQIQESTPWPGIKSRNQHQGQRSNPGINTMTRDQIQKSSRGETVHASHRKGSNPGINTELEFLKFLKIQKSNPGISTHGQGSSPGINTMARDQIQEQSQGEIHVGHPRIKSRNQHHGQRSNPGTITGRNTCGSKASIKSRNQHHGQG